MNNQAIPIRKLVLLLATGVFTLNSQSAPELTCGNCSPYANKVIEEFKRGRPLEATKEQATSKVYHGKCETYRDGHLLKKEMGLLLIDNVAGSLHYSTSFAAYLPEMDQGWNPYRYTSLKAMQESSGGFHLEAEQELYNHGYYSYNKRRVEQPDSYHHIYVGQRNNKLNILGKKGQYRYMCQMQENSDRPVTPTEQGVPISFGENFCDFNYRCHPDALTTITAYHQVKSIDLMEIIGKPLHGTCRLNSGRSRQGTFDQATFNLLRFEKVDEGIILNSSFTQGPKTNPFTAMTNAELESRLNKRKGSGAPLLGLDSFYLALSPSQRTWIRLTNKKLYLLGSWMGKTFTCDIEL